MGEGSGVAVNCGVGCRHGLDLVWLWLWRRPAAVAPIRPPAWELEGKSLGETFPSNDLLQFSFLLLLWRLLTRTWRWWTTPGFAEPLLPLISSGPMRRAEQVYPDFTDEQTEAHTCPSALS